MAIDIEFKLCKLCGKRFEKRHDGWKFFCSRLCQRRFNERKPERLVKRRAYEKWKREHDPAYTAYHKLHHLHWKEKNYAITYIEIKYDGKRQYIKLERDYQFEYEYLNRIRRPRRSFLKNTYKLNQELMNLHIVRKTKGGLFRRPIFIAT